MIKKIIKLHNNLEKYILEKMDYVLDCMDYWIHTPLLPCHMDMGRFEVKGRRAIYQCRHGEWEYPAEIIDELISDVKKDHRIYREEIGPEDCE